MQCALRSIHVRVCTCTGSTIVYRGYTGWVWGNAGVQWGFPGVRVQTGVILGCSCVALTTIGYSQLT